MQRAAAGTTIAGKYWLEHLIGRGGMGAVWRARQLQWAAPVAVKLLDVAFSGSADEPADADRALTLMQRFFSEARAAASIRSPHVVQIIDHGVDHDLGIPYIVMELLEGETLEQRLRSGPLSVATTEQTLTHVGRALARLHDAGCVHRDLKPSNVFLVANEEEIVAKVLDFGIVKTNPQLMEPAPLTRTGEQMGTPYYMSPEQIRGLRNIDFRADLWALGVIAFECLVGKRPFEGETMGDLSLKICADPIPLPSRLARVPNGFDAWFLRCVERERDRTFGSAREAIEALRGVFGVSDASEASFAPSERSASWPRWLGWVSVLFALGLGLSLAPGQRGAASDPAPDAPDPALGSMPAAAKEPATTALEEDPLRAAMQGEQGGPNAKGAQVPAAASQDAAESKPRQAQLRAPRPRPARESDQPPATATSSPTTAVAPARSNAGPPRDLIEDRL